jgi:hypothetical protein
MRHMPAIPPSTRDSMTWRLILHAGKHWPQLAKVEVACRGSFAYIAGVLPDSEQLPLCRLRYGGSAHSFGFAIYSAARERYEDAVLLTGVPAGTPQEALDTACTVHLAGIGHESESSPPTNLRSYPLRFGDVQGLAGVLAELDPLLRRLGDLFRLLP